MLDSSRIPIPLFPRYAVQPVCTQAVHGEFVAPDTVTWKGAHGKVVVDAAALTQDDAMRDAFAHRVVLETNQYPEIVLSIDSVVNVTPSRSGRDTVHAVAVGTLSLHGVNSPLGVPVVAWHDSAGVRVEGRWYILSSELTDKYKISKLALGLGVGIGIWKELWLGIDLVMRPEPLTL